MAKGGVTTLHTLMVNSHDNPPMRGFTIPILHIQKQELKGAK